MRRFSLKQTVDPKCKDFVAMAFRYAADHKINPVDFLATLAAMVGTTIATHFKLDGHEKVAEFVSTTIDDTTKKSMQLKQLLESETEGHA